MNTSQLEIGNDFFRKSMALIPEKFRDCSVEEWTPTPWMIDVHFGDNETEIMRWLRLNLGRDSSPMHGQVGNWKRSWVTMLSRGWLGFKTEEMLEIFKSEFPDNLEIRHPHAPGTRPSAGADNRPLEALQ